MYEAKRVSRDRLVSMVDCVFHPAGKNLTSEEINRELFDFCVNCPDPVRAMDLVVQAPRGKTPSEVVDEALALPQRDPNTYSERELPRGHPFRDARLID